MVLPAPFTTTAPAIATFSFNDIIDGTGVVDMFLIKSETSTGAEHELITKATSGTHFGTLGIVLNEGSFDFDLTPFSSPRDVTGTATFSAEFSIATVGAWIEMKLVKYDGSTETDISSVIRSQDAIAANTTTIFFTLDLTNTHFNTGDIIRAKVTTSGAANSVILLDPLGSVGLPAKLSVSFRNQL